MNTYDKYIIGDIPIYYINLNRSQDRNNLLLNYLKNNKITNFKRIEAIDGNVLNPESLKNKYIINSSISVYEIACTLSHYKAIEEFLKDDEEYGLIIEDDCKFDYLKYQNITLTQLVNMNKNWEILKISSTDKLRRGKLTNFEKLIKNKFNTLISGSTVAYIITKSGAKRLIDHINKNKTTVNVADEFNFYGFLNTKSIYPPYFTYPYYKQNKSCIRRNVKSAHATQTISKQFWDKYYSTQKDYSLEYNQS